MLNRFIQRPILSIVVSLLIVFLGLLSYASIPVTQFPSISPPKVTVIADYPGANNELLIKAVVIPLERAINGAPGLKYIASDAGNDGEANIEAVFNLGTDPNSATLAIQNRVASVVNKLPPVVVREGVKISREEPNMLLYVNVYSDDPQADQKFLYNFADINILSELQRVDGVGFADILGNREYAMRIWLKPDRMLAFKVSADEVMAALSAQSLEASPGKTGESSGKRSQSFEYVLKYPGRFTTKEEYENVVIRASANGEILHLKDIADVEFGNAVYDIYSNLNGKPSAAIVLKQSYGSNASVVIANVKAKLAEISRSSFPKGMHYEISYDVSRFLDASIEKVLHTLVEAFVLVAVVVFLFLGDWRSTLIPAFAVPVSLIGTFAFMEFFGISLNLITLFALVLAIGIVVDNAIVVIEAVHAIMEAEGLAPLEATRKAIGQIAGAIIAITLVMAAVFIPVGFLPGPVGIFYRQFSITLDTAIIISAVVALTLTPALCAMLLRPHVHGERKTPVGRFLDAFNRWFGRTQGRYVQLLSAIASRRIVTFGALALLCVATWFAGRTVHAGFIPNEDQGMFYAVVQTPPGSTLERTNDIVSRLQRVAQTIDGVQSVSTLAGYEILSEGTGSNSGTCLINLKDWSDRQHSADEIMAELEEKSRSISGANIEYFLPPALPGYGAAGGFELRLLDKSGSGDYKAMERINDEFVSALSKRKELSSVFSFYSASFPQYLVRIDNELAQQKGVSPDIALNTLSTLLGSDYEISFIKYDRQYKVIVQAAPEYRALPSDILKLYVKNNRDEMVPFADFMRMEKVYGLSEITRHNLSNSSEISGSAAAGYSSREAIRAVTEVARASLPRGFDIDWAGISLDEVRQGNQAIWIFLISLGFVYLILSAQYESFLLPLAVILSLPAGILGAFLFLLLTGLENNIYAQVAMVMLIGLLGKNAVLIVEFASQRHSEGRSVVEATIEGAKARFRPILMTSFAFIAGLVPLMVATGPGKIGNRTIGTAAFGGMLLGTVLGVVLIPGLYYLVARTSERHPMIPGEDETPLSEV